MNDSSKLNVTLHSIDQKESSALFPEHLSDRDLLDLLKFSTELAADEVFWMSSDSEIFYANSAACKTLGYTREELIGKRVWEWDPLFPEEVWPVFWQELKQKLHIDFETRHQKKDGTVFPVRIKGHFVSLRGKEVLFAFVSDVSDVKNNELELQQQSNRMLELAKHKSALLEQEKRKFEEFVNLAPVGITINRLEDGRFEYVNKEFSRFTGYETNELNAMDYWDLTPSKYEIQEQAQLESMRDTGKYGPYSKEYIHKQGYTYPVMLSGVKITELDGKDYIWSVVQDMSLQKQNEAQIQLAKEEAQANALRMKLANDSAEIGVWEWNLETNELVWDHWMYHLYGVSEDTFSGAYEAWEKSVHPDDIGDARAKLKAAIEGTGIYDPEFRVVRPDGQIRTMKASADVLRDEQGKPRKVIGVNYDVTEKVNALQELAKAKREAEDANQAKSEFLANMSHEIRTPMNAILGGLQLLKKSELDNDSNNILSKATYSAKSLLTILNDILDYSKIEENKLNLEQKQFSVIDATESVRYDLKEFADEKEIELVVEVAADFSDGWVGDIVRVKQVLLNLASNAVKFTHSGRVVIKLSSIQYNAQPAIRFDVIDSGIGMSEEAQSRVFERFAQADTSTTRKFGGTGLGMSITVNLVKMMNGWIDLKSQKGRGTHVSVVLPLAKTELQNQQVEKEEVLPPDLSDKVILVAEDNEINKVILESMLEPTGATLVMVENGLMAIEQVKKNTFDLVLMDIHMPTMDGIEAQSKIRQFNKNLPVIAITANVMIKDIEQYHEQGFASHIGKPIEMDDLYKTLAVYAR